MPKAASLAAEIEQRLGVKAELIKGANGVFDVAADGVLIYSKHSTGRFPENAEVLQALRGVTKT